VSLIKLTTTTTTTTTTATTATTVVFLLWQVVPYVAGNGPVWHHMVAPITSSCSENWWKTLLFINVRASCPQRKLVMHNRLIYRLAMLCRTFISPMNNAPLGHGTLLMTCSSTSWRLSCSWHTCTTNLSDGRSPVRSFPSSAESRAAIVIISIARLLTRVVGHRSVFLFIGSIVANMVTSIEFDLVAYPLLNSLGLGEPVEVSAEASTNVMANIYFLPWTRCGPYLVGFMMAYILLEKGEHYSVPAGIRIISLALSGLVIVVLIFITYTEANFGWKSQAISVIWFSFSRQVWAIGTIHVDNDEEEMVVVVVEGLARGGCNFAELTRCATTTALGTWILFMIWGFGGPIRKFLSLRIWVPLARLSFSAYLWQSVVIVRVV